MPGRYGQRMGRLKIANNYSLPLLCFFCLFVCFIFFYFFGIKQKKFIVLTVLGTKEQKSRGQQDLAPSKSVQEFLSGVIWLLVVCCQSSVLPDLQLHHASLFLEITWPSPCVSLFIRTPVLTD